MEIQNEENKVRKIYQMLFEMATGNMQFQITNLKEADEIDQIANDLNHIALNLRETILKVGHVIPQFTYQNLVQHTFILNEKLCIISFTPEILNTLNFEPNEIIHSKFSELIAKQSLKEWKLVEENLIQNNQISCTLFLNILDKSNQIYPSYFTISSLIKSKKILVSGITTNLKDYTCSVLINKPCAQNNTTDIATIIQNIHDYILNNLEDPLPSTREFAKKFGSNEFKIKEQFKKSFNTSIYKFYTNQRLNTAQYLIQKTDIPIKEIAFICGFNDYNNFSKAFKKKFNYTPNKLKRNID